MPNYFKIDKFDGHIGRIDQREKYTLFSVAYNPGKKEDNKPACWFQCKAVGKAHVAMESMGKGDAVTITNMSPETWKDRDGNERWTWIVFDIARWVGRDGATAEPAPQPDFGPDDDIPF